MALIAPRIFVDNMFSTISSVLLENKNLNIPSSVASEQIDNLINEFRFIFEDLLEGFVTLVFPDRVSSGLQKRDNVTISPAAFIAWSSQLLSTLNAWVASPSFNNFACLYQSASNNFNLVAAQKSVLVKLDNTVSVVIIRLNAATAGSTSAATALRKVKASSQSAVGKLMSPILCTPGTSTSASFFARPTSSGATSNSVLTVLSTRTVVVDAISTKLITVCIKCVQTTVPGFIVVTKPISGVIATITESCNIVYIPDSTSTIYFGGTTKTVTEACNKCVATSAAAPVIPTSVIQSDNLDGIATNAPFIGLTTYVTTQNSIKTTVTAYIPSTKSAGIYSSVFSSDNDVVASSSFYLYSSPRNAAISSGASTILATVVALPSPSSDVAQANSGVTNSALVASLTGIFLAAGFVFLV